MRVKEIYQVSRINRSLYCSVGSGSNLSQAENSLESISCVLVVNHRSYSLTVLFGFVAIFGSDLCTQHCCQPGGPVGVVSGCESAPAHQCLCRLQARCHVNRLPESWE